MSEEINWKSYYQQESIEPDIYISNLFVSIKQ